MAFEKKNYCDTINMSENRNYIVHFMGGKLLLELKYLVTVLLQCGNLCYYSKMISSLLHYLKPMLLKVCSFCVILSCHVGLHLNICKRTEVG